MPETTLNKMTITEDEIDNYIDTLTNTITSTIAEKVLNPNSASYNYPTLSVQRKRWDKDLISDYDRNTGDVRFPTKLGTIFPTRR